MILSPDPCARLTQEALRMGPMTLLAKESTGRLPARAAAPDSLRVHDYARAHPPRRGRFAWVCAKIIAEAEFSVCHCSVSSAAGFGGTAENTRLTEQWHTAAPIVIILAHTRSLCVD